LKREDWSFLYQVNLFGPVNLAQLVLKEWKKQAYKGAFVFTSSVAAKSVIASTSCYSSAKIAMEVSQNYYHNYD
jgi:NAD(P)-dependent dehydrogenase (short-subunit alcohol dehydrogenase family)